MRTRAKSVQHLPASPALIHSASFAVALLGVSFSGLESMPVYAEWV